MAAYIISVLNEKNGTKGDEKKEGNRKIKKRIGKIVERRTEDREREREE